MKHKFLFELQHVVNNILTQIKSERIKQKLVALLYHKLIDFDFSNYNLCMCMFILVKSEETKISDYKAMRVKETWKNKKKIS